MSKVRKKQDAKKRTTMRMGELLYKEPRRNEKLAGEERKIAKGGGGVSG